MFFVPSTSSADLLALENDRLRLQLQKEQATIRSLQAQLQAQHATAAEATSDRLALEREYATLKSFITNAFNLPKQLPRLSVTSVLPSAKSASPPRHRTSRASFLGPLLEESSDSDSDSMDEPSVVAPKASAKDAATVLAQSAANLMTLHRSSSERVLRDNWCEEPIVAPAPPARDAWNKLLLDWAQGDARKHAYLSEWLAYHLNGQRHASPYANPRVELKSLTPAQLDGFKRLVLPALRAARPDLDVRGYSKDYIGHSLRIVLDGPTSPIRSSLASIAER
ncbi:hypothetical protein SPRG_02228 [Saprolegnia parasitica CBS 223.65]|uniref:Uncharacterized protein n=1 Tax=Saprolegnia parasitica (strain CBS 223.65) TaxID=695850 RepID=A0A067D3U7_SAPPC|nr:hypothetical protein SPRG_02228 [Saprolegnia parasitica CBS 223.65]KDO33421.1 hypothetical protein SPRG_02228 [Saprolegnia parasitica CBS 223.65]|eukprot:XP_012196167.1 hypothetical protein SPRG_02228 [Saprolegnia parasitica CBS 223.65]